MENMPSESEFARTAALLNQLQQQLIRYKTALDSIDEISTATQKVADEVANLTKTFEALNQSQAELSKNYEDTRRALIITQQRAQQIRKDLEELSQGFTRTISGTMEKAVRSVEQKIEEFVSPDRDMLRQEVRRLKFYLFGNILVMFVLFLSIFLYFSNGSAPARPEAQTPPLTRQMPSPGKPAATPVPAPAETALRDVPKIQLLNGCGVSGVAQQFEAFLKKYDLKVANTDNAENFDYIKTVIYLRGDYPDEAARIARLMGVSLDMVKPAGNRWQDYNITVIIGKDYKALLPARPQ